ncbi:MAG: SIMPL domain-containing protein [Chitinophagaceae bacterium]
MRSTLLAIILGISFIIAIAIAANAYKFRSTTMDTIVVTGLAEQDFSSDLIVWNATFSRKSFDLKTAYTTLKEDETAIRNYLHGKGLNDSSIIFSSVDIAKDFDYKQDINGRSLGAEFTGYTLSQNVKVESNDVDKIEKISREVTELIQNGIELNSAPPSYYNTHLTQVKMDLLAKASADAKARAETIAKNAGSKLGNMKKATMGVFQITGKNSNEDYSFGGTFNTSSKQKTGSLTIRMEFLVN